MYSLVLRFASGRPSARPKRLPVAAALYMLKSYYCCCCCYCYCYCCCCCYTNTTTTTTTTPATTTTTTTATAITTTTIVISSYDYNNDPCLRVELVPRTIFLPLLLFCHYNYRCTTTTTTTATTTTTTPTTDGSSCHCPSSSNWSLCAKVRAFVGQLLSPAIIKKTASKPTGAPACLIAQSGDLVFVRYSSYSCILLFKWWSCSLLYSELLPGIILLPL